MKKAKTCLIILVIVLLGTLGGCAAGYAIGSAPEDPSNVQWQRLPDPPERPIRIVEIGGYGTDAHSLYIAAASGKQYECCGSLLARWKEVGVRNIPDNTGCIQPGNEAQTSLFDQLPGEVVDCAFVMQWEWTTEQHYVALLEDGSLWRWRFHRGMDTLFNSLVWGSLIGLVCGIAIAVYVTWRGKTTSFI
jgi:hypothetical protein